MRLVTVAFAALLSVAGMLPSAASALDVWIPAPTNQFSRTVIGIVAGDGDAWALTDPDTQNGTDDDCVYSFLGEGGLTAATRIIGSSGHDTIELVGGSSNSICGYKVNFLVARGWELQVLGQGSRDELFCYTDLSTKLRGGSGEDSVVGLCSFTAFPAYGGSGDDMLIGASINNALFGEDGNDYLSARFLGVLGPGMRRADGGDGRDTLCGSSTFVTSIETRACL